MKLKIDKDHFVSGLQRVSNIVGSKSTMPILNNVLLVAEGQQLLLTTTNLEQGIRCCITAEIEEEGAITLPVRKLSNIVRSLPNQDIHFQASDHQQAKLESGSSRFRLMGLPRDDFPMLPTFEDHESLTLQQGELSRMLRSVAYAQSADEDRQFLNGVYFSFEGNQLIMVATDGRRLAYVGKEMEEVPEHLQNIIVPAKTVVELQRLLDLGTEVIISLSGTQVAFRISIDNEKETSGLVDHLYLVSKMVEGNFPDYHQVIPRETEQRIQVERELFLDSVNRAALMTSDKNHSIRIQLSLNNMKLTSSSSEYGEAEESIAVAYEGPEITVSFNPDFLVDPLKHLDKDEVYFEFKDELSPGVIKTLDHFLCVIMPLRTGQ